MIRYLRLAFAVYSVLVAMVVGAAAQFGVPLNRPDPNLEPANVRELVARYCRLDYAGARLNPQYWGKLQPLVAWSSNPDFPLFMTTSRFDVDADSTQEHGRYVVTVHYRLIGKYDLTEGFTLKPGNQVEDVQFVVSGVNGDWRITDAEPSYPHPSRAATVQWLNSKLANEKDPVARTLVQNALEKLQAPKAAAPGQ